jgi:hypothetical protein
LVHDSLERPNLRREWAHLDFLAKFKALVGARVKGSPGREAR